MKVLPLVVVSLLVQNAIAQQPLPGSVQGVVLRAGSQEPVSGAVLELRRSGSNVEPLLAASQSNGSFVFHSVPPGRYQLFATRAGYLPVELGQRRLSGRGFSFTVAAGEQVHDLRLAMTPTAAISGRVVDRANQPVPGVVVQVLKPAFEDGRRTLTVVKSVLTNDLGDYRAFWLPPGSYYVNVLPPANPDTVGPAGANLIMNPGGQAAGRSLWSNLYNVAVRPVGNGLPENQAYLPVFFPETSDEASATPVDLRAGADLEGVDIRIAPIRGWQVRGVLTGLAGQPAARVGVQLVSLAAGSGYTARATTDTMGVFTFSRIPSGLYVLLASSGELSRQAVVEVRDADIDVSIGISSSYSISGRVIVERQTGQTSPPPTDFSVRLRMDYPIANVPQLNVAPATDGAFVFKTVPAGDYRILVPPVMMPAASQPVPFHLQNTHVKSIRMGTTDLLNLPFRIDRPQDAPLEIIIGTNPGSLSGRVLNGAREPIAAATVVLLPDLPQRLRRTDLYKVAATDASGYFQLESLPPGDYRLFAWEDVADGAWHDPAFLNGYQELGKPIHIGEGSRQDVEVTAIP